MILIRQARAILSLLQPMNGDIATGVASVSALSAPVTLERNEYLLPVHQGRLLTEYIFKTTENVTIGTTPTTFGIKSILGHPDHNLPVGTKLVFDPPIEGLEEAATITTATTGAQLYTGFGSVKHIGLYEDIGNDVEKFFSANMKNTPALLLGWAGSGGSDTAGRGVAHMEDRWGLIAVSAKATSNAARRDEGLWILDEATEWLFDRQHVDGECFSTPANIEILGRSRRIETPSLYCYELQFKTQRTVSKRDRRTFPAFASSTLTMPSTTGDGEPLPLVSITIPQP